MSKMGWSTFNPHYSSLLLYQDKYGSTDRPLGTQESPYATSSGEKTYGVKGQSTGAKVYGVDQSYRTYEPSHKPYLHGGGGSVGASHAAFPSRAPYASAWDLRERPYTSSYSWEVQRAMVQTEVPYSRSVHALKLGGVDARPTAAAAAPTCSKCSKCSCSNCGCGGGGGGGGGARGGGGPSHPHYRATYDLDSSPMSSSSTRHINFHSGGVGSGDRGVSSSRFLVDPGSDRFGDSVQGLHRRFPSKRIGTASSAGYSAFNRPARRFTVAGIYG